MPNHFLRPEIISPKPLWSSASLPSYIQNLRVAMRTENLAFLVDEECNGVLNITRSSDVS